MSRFRLLRRIVSFLVVTVCVAVLIVLVCLPSHSTVPQRFIRRRKYTRNERFTFLALGDFGGRGYKPYSSRTQRQVAFHMAQQAEHYNVTVIVGLGDNFYPHGVKNVDDPRFQTTFENVYSAPSLKRAKWMMVAGNHDYEQNVKAEIEYAKKSHRWHFPYFYYSEVYRIPSSSLTIQIVMIDTKILCWRKDSKKAVLAGNKFPTKQDHWKWVQKTLHESRADYLIVVGHHPILTVGRHGKSACLESFLKPLLQKYHVTLYISGHDHNFQHIQKDALNYIVSGNGNYYDRRRNGRHIELKNDLKRFYGSSGGFTMLSANSSSLQVTHINSTGHTIYTTCITPRIT